MPLQPRIVHACDDAVTDLVLAYGVTTAPTLLDGSTTLFRHDHGVIGYRDAFGCSVALGDPVAAPEHQPAMAKAFHEFCRRRRRQTVYAVITAEWAEWAAANGYAITQFGKELVFAPHPDPLAPPGKKKLRWTVRNARRHGVEPAEYHRDRDRDPALDRELEQVAASWVASRSGVQFHLGDLLLWALPRGARWFFATAGGRAVGVALLHRLDRYDGYLLWHLAVAPFAPPGTSETLLTEVLATLGREGVPWLFTGASAGESLDDVRNLGALSAGVARAGYGLANLAAHLEGRLHYLRKFHPVRQEPVYLAFKPARVGIATAFALMRTVNLGFQLGRTGR